AICQPGRALDDYDLHRRGGGGTPSTGCQLALRLLACGEEHHLEWDSPGRPEQVHVLACYLLRMVLQHGHAHRHGGYVTASLCKEMAIRLCFFRRHDPGTLYRLGGIRNSLRPLPAAI